MLNKLFNIGMGMGISAFTPDWATKESRIEEQVGKLADSRNADNWYHLFQRRVIDTTSGKLVLRVHEVENPKGVFVFMPGTNAYALLYGQFLLAISKLGYHVIAFDPRGHGSSDGKRGSYTIEELLDDFTEVVNFSKSYGLPITVSGSSQGGIVAFYYALMDSNIEAAICHNIADLSLPSSVYLTRFGKFGHYLKPMIKSLSSTFPELPVPMPLYLDLQREKVKGFDNALQVLLQDPLVPWFVRLKTMNSLGESKPPKAIESLQVPTLIIQAENDTIFPASYIQKLADKSPKTDMVIIPDSFHYVIVDEVDKVIDAIVKWKKTRQH